jgi:hypothetical protein
MGLTDLPEPEAIVPRAARRNRVQIEDLSDEVVLLALLDSGFLDSEEHAIFTRSLRKAQTNREVPVNERKRARERFAKIGLDADKVAAANWRGEIAKTVAPFDDKALGPKAVKPPNRR